MVIKVYTSRECGNTKIKRDQAYIMRILYIKKIDVEEIDLSDPNRKSEKERMQEMLRVNENELKALPPQIFNEDQPVGVFAGFEDAVEQDCLYSFLNLEIPDDEIEYLSKSSEEVNQHEEDKARRELSKVSVVLDEMTEELSNVKEELDTVKQEVHKEKSRADNLQKKLDRVLSVPDIAQQVSDILENEDQTSLNKEDIENIADLEEKEDEEQDAEGNKEGEEEEADQKEEEDDQEDGDK